MSFNSGINPCGKIAAFHIFCIFCLQDIATAVKAKESGDSQAATATLDSTLERIATSSESSDPEVQTLAEDVQTVKDEVSAEEVNKQ